MTKCCGSCRHWRAFGSMEKDLYEVPTFGTCAAVQQHDSYSHEDTTSWKACVTDGSGYFAALRTKEDFGCVLFLEGQR